MEVRSRSGYLELAPPAALAPFVRCVWVHCVDEGDAMLRQPVLPDACIDIVTSGDAVVVAGPATRTTVVEMAPGSETVGVRFRPGAAPALLGPSARELRDLTVPLADMWDADVGERVVSSASRVDALVGVVLARLDRAYALDDVGVGVAGMLQAEPGRAITEVARDVGLSDRQLRRRVEDAVGYPPRTLARILRFQRFLDAARQYRPGRHLAWLAADAGYADQAHLTRESRELTGLPPAALLRWESERLAG